MVPLRPIISVEDVNLCVAHTGRPREKCTESGSCTGEKRRGPRLWRTPEYAPTQLSPEARRLGIRAARKYLAPCDTG